MPDNPSKQPILGSFSCRRSAHEGVLEVLNENNYVMGEYNRRTGVLKWKRLVLAGQRDAIEKWFAEHYPV